MLRIVTKRHAETRRFKDTGLRFHAEEWDDLMKHVRSRLQTEYMVQIQSDSGFTSGWYELRTERNPNNALLH